MEELSSGIFEEEEDTSGGEDQEDLDAETHVGLGCGLYHADVGGVHVLLLHTEVSSRSMCSECAVAATLAQASLELC